jgi:imidazolonepropionase-like amidohydrolase
VGTEPATLSLRGGAVFDLESERFEPRTVSVEGARIATVAEPRKRSRAAQALDLGGVYLMPGLVDAHCHLIERSSETIDERVVALGMTEGFEAAERALRLGVTTARDAGTRHLGIHPLRDLLARRPDLGPRPLAAGPNIAGSTVPRDWRVSPADGPKAVRAAVRRAADEGADWIKLIVGSRSMTSSRSVRHLDDAEIRAATGAAHELGLRVGAHCESDGAACAAVLGGVDCIEHGLGLTRATLGLMADRNVAFVPTLAAYSPESQLAAGQIEAADVDDYRATIALPHLRSVGWAAELGVRLAAGSDGGYLGGPTILDELAALEAAGL